MEGCFRAVSLTRPRQGPGGVSAFGAAAANKVRAFHASFPEYAVTPLADLSRLASILGLAGVYVKDESFRFGLNAFKALGSSYAIGCSISDKLGIDISELPYEVMTGDEVREKLGEVTFVTATDGNHGRGVAWTANRLRQKSVVYMPRGTARERLENIRALGADASITDLKYDDAVRLSRRNAEKYGWVVVQDTSWEGYEDVPLRIMQGYTTMALEAAEQLEAIAVPAPTHVFLQAGVGSMAGAVTGFLRDRFGVSPVITVVEPNRADCLYRTAEANDGRLHAATGEMDTIMAGLACGEPCPLAWEVLKDHADHFLSIPEYAAAKGMRVLGCPAGDDRRVISGESGASALGALVEIMEDPGLGWLREKLELGPQSRVLCFSTEGDTDRENYRRIVWDGAWPSR